MPEQDEVAAAKARFKEAAAKVDPLGVVHRHPFLTAIAAGAVLGLLSVERKRLSDTATIARSFTKLLHDGVALVEKFMAPKA